MLEPLPSMYQSPRVPEGKQVVVSINHIVCTNSLGLVRRPSYLEKILHQCRELFASQIPRGQPGANLTGRALPVLAQLYQLFSAQEKGQKRRCGDVSMASRFLP